MALRNDYIASIDIGTDKIAVLVAEKEDDEKLRIIGHNICPSDGVRRGSISSIDPLSRVISKIVEQTQKSFDLEIALVRVNLSDTHITCKDGYGKVPIREVVTLDDIDTVSYTHLTLPTILLV